MMVWEELSYFIARTSFLKNSTVCHSTGNCSTECPNWSGNCSL